VTPILSGMARQGCKAHKGRVAQRTTATTGVHLNLHHEKNANPRSAAMIDAIAVANAEVQADFK
jgi:hypothetical protein